MKQNHPSYDAKSCKSTLVLCQKVQNYAKAPFMNLNNAKAASFYAKTCKTPNVLIQIMQKHTLLMQNPAKVAIVLIRNVRIMQNHAKAMQNHAKAHCF